MKKYVYIPWFSSNPTYNLLFESIPKDVKFINFSLDTLSDTYNDRFDIIGAARRGDDKFRDSVTACIKHYSTIADALIVTFDWLDCMRFPVEVANSVGLPTVLIPHEGIMQNESLYYKDIKKDSNDIPLCKASLVWGNKHESLFKGRGYTGKLVKVGSPKLDLHTKYKPSVTKGYMLKSIGLIRRPTILFSCQYFDTQWGDRDVALKGQMRAIKDMLSACTHLGYNLIVRCPPGNPTRIFSKRFMRKLNSEVNCFVDGYKGKVARYNIEANDAIHLCDMVVSFNSTMILEASIANKPTAIFNHFEYDKIWHDRYGVPLISSIEDCMKISESIKLGRTMKEFKLASEEFSCGSFDGNSVSRIYDELKGI